MANRARRRRRQRRRTRRHRRMRTRRTHSSYPNTPDCCTPSDGMQIPNAIKRALLTGGIVCLAIGIVCFSRRDASGFLNLIAVICLFFGVLMLGFLLANGYCFTKKEEFNPAYLTDVIVHQPVSSPQQRPMIPHSNYSFPPVPPRTTSSPVGGSYLPAGAPQGHFPTSGTIPSVPLRPFFRGGAPQGRLQPVGTILSPVSGSFPPGGVPRGPSPVHGQPAGYHPGGSPQVSRYPHASRVSPSRHSASSGGPVTHHPSPFGGQNSRNPSPARRPRSQLPSDRGQSPAGDGPPSYRSVVSERPWENPPSYVEASSCLVVRSDPGESSLSSAPNISNDSDRDPPT